MTDSDEEKVVLDETWRLTARMLATVAQLEKFTAELNAEITRVEERQDQEEPG